MNYKKNKREAGITLLILLIIMMAIVLVIMVTALIICIKAEETEPQNIDDYNISNKIENKVSNNRVKKVKNTTNEVNTTEIEMSQNSNEETDSVIKPIKLNVNGKETTMNGAEILHINDYKITVPETFVNAGYEITEDGDALDIKVNDGSYECKLIQLSDSYVMPTEEESNGFYESEEYKAWEEEEVDYDNDEAIEQHYAKRDEIFINYYKNLGYTPQNSPDYVLSTEEIDEIVGKYYIDKNDSSAGSNNLFPGYYSYSNYDWGRVKIYTIPKYYKDSKFGENTSNFSICLYMFEYYDLEDNSIDDLSLVTYE